MPQHATSTSFKPGHSLWTPERTAKRIATLRAKYSVWPTARPEVVAKVASANRMPLGSRRVESHGYVKVRTKRGWEYEHRIVAERHIGRRLRANEVVHHRDHDKTNNAWSNLEVMTKSKHSTHHSTGRTPKFRGRGSMLAGKWSRRYGDRCADCGTNEQPHFSRGLCRNCHARWWRKQQR